jgi:NADH-ubiquinone oxidoreductase chain 3
MNYNLVILFIIVSALAIILLGLNFLLSPHKPDEAKLSIYECGFLTVPLQTRSTFYIHFYLVGLLFLVFDLEILLLFPVSLTLYKISIYGFAFAIIFFIILTIGFVLEIGYGAISLVKLDSNNSKMKNEYNNMEQSAASTKVLSHSLNKNILSGKRSIHTSAINLSNINTSSIPQLSNQQSSFISQLSDQQSNVNN